MESDSDDSSLDYARPAFADSDSDNESTTAEDVVPAGPVQLLDDAPTPLPALDMELNPSRDFLILLTQLTRLLIIRKISELSNGETRALLGEGATSTVHKVTNLRVKDLWNPGPCIGGETLDVPVVALKTAKHQSVNKAADGTVVTAAMLRRLKTVLFEVQVLSRPDIARHPNIISLLAYSYWHSLSGYDERSWSFIPDIALEFSPWGNARNFFAQGPGPPRSDAYKLALCRDVAAGLAFLHAYGITHGDVKLENVLIFPGPLSIPVAKIADIELSPQNPAFGPCAGYMGTEAYLAPEVAGARINGSHLPVEELWYCDVFAFGLLVLEVFASVDFYWNAGPSGSLLLEQIKGGATVPAVDDDTALSLALNILQNSLESVSGSGLFATGQQLLEATLQKSPLDRLPSGWPGVHERLAAIQTPKRRSAEAYYGHASMLSLASRNAKLAFWAIFSGVWNRIIGALTPVMVPEASWANNGPPNPTTKTALIQRAWHACFPSNVIVGKPLKRRSLQDVLAQLGERPENNKESWWAWWRKSSNIIFGRDDAFPESTVIISSYSVDEPLSYDILQVLSHVDLVCEYRWGGTVWAELERLATTAPTPQERGQARFGLFICATATQYAPCHITCIEDALNLLASAANDGYAPACVIGKRVFEANHRPAPSILAAPLPEHASDEMRRELATLENADSSEYYSIAVRVLWPLHLRDQIRRSLGVQADSHAFTAELINKAVREMGRGFKKYADAHSLLHHGIISSNIAACRRLLKLGVNVNLQILDGITPLSLACRFAEYEIVRLLLAYNANPCILDEAGSSPLHWLITTRDEDSAEVLKLMLKNISRLGGSSPGDPGLAVSYACYDQLAFQPQGTALEWAILSRHSTLIGALLGSGLIRLAGREELMHYFSMAAATTCPETVRAVARHFKDAKFTIKDVPRLLSMVGKNAWGSTELYRWIAHGPLHQDGYRATIDSILDLCGIPTDIDFSVFDRPEAQGRGSPMVIATITFRIEVITELARRGSGLNVVHGPTDNQECGYSLFRTPLEWAISSSHATGPLYRVCAGIKTVWSLGGTKTINDTPIGIAVSSLTGRNDKEGQRILKEVIGLCPGAINTQNRSGKTPLQCMIISDSADIERIQAFLDAGADLSLEAGSSRIDSWMDKGRTAVAESIPHCRWDNIEYLLDHGSPLEFGTLAGEMQTLLHLVVFDVFLISWKLRPYVRRGSPHIEDHLIVLRNLVLYCHQKRDVYILLALNHTRWMSPAHLAMSLGLPLVLKTLIALHSETQTPGPYRSVFEFGSVQYYKAMQDRGGRDEFTFSVYGSPCSVNFEEYCGKLKEVKEICDEVLYPGEPPAIREA